jgi:hypothetical protein
MNKSVEGGMEAVVNGPPAKLRIVSVLQDDQPQILWFYNFVNIVG